MRACWLASAILLFACRDNPQRNPPRTEEFGGWYRAVLLPPDFDEIPFFLSLPRDASTGGAVVLNGKSWFSVPHRWEAERVEVDFSMYRTKILAAVGANGDLIGTWEANSRPWGSASVPFRAVRIKAPDLELKMRTSSSAAPEIDPSGTWKLTLEKSGPGKIVIQKEGATSFGGTMWYSGAETCYLAGNVIGQRLVMSAFDGASPYYFAIEMVDDRMHGTWATAGDLSFREAVSGKRVSEDFSVPEPVRVTSPDTRLRLPELEHPRYAKAPVIVELAASWCSHCGSAAPVLADLHRRHESDDLKLITINYEFTKDKSYNLERAAQFKSDYGVTWELVTREGDVEEFANIIPTGLTPADGVPAFPIVVFLRRDHSVHKIHSGFVGPESGEAHQRLVRNFETWTKQILK